MLARSVHVVAFREQSAQVLIGGRQPVKVGEKVAAGALLTEKLALELADDAKLDVEQIVSVVDAPAVRAAACAGVGAAHAGLTVTKSWALAVFFQYFLYKVPISL